MEHILYNSPKYEDLAKQFEFDKNKWDKEKAQCLFSLLTAIETFSKDYGYSIELSTGKEPCININPLSQSGRVRGRTAGIYAVPREGKVKLFLNENAYNNLHGKYELPDCKVKNGQPYCYLNFCELCSVIEAIVSL